MVMDAALHDWCAPLPGGSKRDAHLPIYPQIAAAATDGFTTEELESLLYLPSDGADAGGFLNAPAPLLRSPSASSDGASPPRDASVSSAAAVAGARHAHPDDSEAFSDIVLGYINRMLMAEDIDEKFDHYPAHAALLAAEKPFLEILADQPPNSGGSTVESPDGSSLTNSCNSLSSCTCAAPSTGLVAVQTPPALEFSTAEFLQPALLYRDLSPESPVVEPGGAWPYDAAEFYQLQSNPAVTDTLLSQSSSFASSNGSSVAFSEGFESFLSTAGAVPDAGLSDFVLQSQHAAQFSRGFEEASRFLPQESKLVIDVDSLPSVANFQAGVKEEKKFVEVKTEKPDAEVATVSLISI